MSSKRIKFGRNNGYLPTPAPCELPELYPEEEMMIARININVKIYVKRHGMTGMVGQIIHF